MAQLTPEQLKLLQDYFAKNPSAMQYQDPSGMRYAATHSGQMGENGQMTGPLVGYSSANGAWQPGQQAQGYDTQGNQTGSWEAENPYTDSAVEKMVKLGLIAGSGAAAMGMGGTTGLFGGGAAGGPGSAGWGMDLGGAGMADTSYMANIGGAGGLGGGPGSAGWGMDLGGAGLADTTYAANIGAGGLGGAGTTAGGASSVLGGAKGLLSGNLGTLLTAGGALLGAQGNKSEKGAETKMDPRLDGPVFGQGGVVPLTANFLTRAMDPNGPAMKGWQGMAQQGQNMMTAPMAPNGFERFYGRK